MNKNKIMILSLLVGFKGEPSSLDQLMPNMQNGVFGEFSFLRLFGHPPQLLYKKNFSHKFPVDSTSSTEVRQNEKILVDNIPKNEENIVQQQVEVIDSTQKPVSEEDDDVDCHVISEEELSAAQAGSLTQQLPEKKWYTHVLSLFGY